MKPTQVSINFNVGLSASVRKDPDIQVYFRNEDSHFEAIFDAANSHMLIFQGIGLFNLNIDAKSIIELLAGCFEEGSNLQQVFKSKISAIVIEINEIPVLISCYNNNVEKIYAEWQEANKEYKKLKP